MLYIVLLPVKPDNIRRIVIMHTTAYANVRKALGLPDGWQSWIAITDIELNNLMSCNDQNITKFMCRDTY